MLLAKKIIVAVGKEEEEELPVTIVKTVEYT
jgi:hypothetical protein